MVSDSRSPTFPVSFPLLQYQEPIPVVSCQVNNEAFSKTERPPFLVVGLSAQLAALVDALLPCASFKTNYQWGENFMCCLYIIYLKPYFVKLYLKPKLNLLLICLSYLRVHIPPLFGI